MRTTERGFRLHEFRDRNREPCSLQESSSALEHCVWLGVTANRMHLTQADVRALLPLLQHFAETGELPDDEAREGEEG